MPGKDWEPEITKSYWAVPRHTSTREDLYPMQQWADLFRMDGEKTAHTDIGAGEQLDVQSDKSSRQSSDSSDQLNQNTDADVRRDTSEVCAGKDGANMHDSPAIVDSTVDTGMDVNECHIHNDNVQPDIEKSDPSGHVTENVETDQRSVNQNQNDIVSMETDVKTEDLPKTEETLCESHNVDEMMNIHSKEVLEQNELNKSVSADHSDIYRSQEAAGNFKKPEPASTGSHELEKSCHNSGSSHPKEKDSDALGNTDCKSDALKECTPSVVAPPGGKPKGILLGYREPQSSEDFSVDSDTTSDDSSEESSSIAITSSSSDVELRAAGSKRQDGRPFGRRKNRTDSTSEELKTKGELLLENLPPIEELRVTVDENVVMHEVGTISSIVDTLVIVQAKTDLPALDADTILFLEERKILGLVFETFGPVTAPLYSVRFNTTKDIEDRAIVSGSVVYYAPTAEEYTHYVFLEQLKRMKGSDASWEHNNEPPDRCLDYSDDEQERRSRLGLPRVKPGEEQDDQQAGLNKKRRRRKPRKKQLNGYTADVSDEGSASQSGEGSSGGHFHMRHPISRPMTQWPPPWSMAIRHPRPEGRAWGGQPAVRVPGACQPRHQGRSLPGTPHMMDPTFGSRPRFRGEGPSRGGAWMSGGPHVFRGGPGGPPPPRTHGFPMHPPPRAGPPPLPPPYGIPPAASDGQHQMPPPPMDRRYVQNMEAMGRQDGPHWDANPAPPTDHSNRNHPHPHFPPPPQFGEGPQFPSVPQHNWNPPPSFSHLQ